MFTKPLVFSFQRARRKLNGLKIEPEPFSLETLRVPSRSAACCPLLSDGLRLALCGEAAKPKPRGNLRKLYRELDAAIDRDDFDAAADIKKRIDALKG